MDALDEQLAQLRLLNSRPLSPRNNNINSIYSSPKKIGPAVPPKPFKKSPDESPSPEKLPLVPQSTVVKQHCEPLYSRRLDQNVSTAPPLLHRKHPSYQQQAHLYSNIKMTLDNPSILDQQLEALAHHKKQLEKKGLLINSPPVAASIPKLSSASFANRGSIDGHLYSNLPTPPLPPMPQNSDVVYSNIVHPEDLLPSPPTAVNTNSNYFQNQNNHQDDDEDLPPPPSPVSSSYSELRRATDNNYPKMPQYPPTGTISSTGGIIGTDHSTASTISSIATVGGGSGDYYGYGTYSQGGGSTTYESIYEPINPRPPSQLSSRSNYSLYTSYANGPQSSSGSRTPLAKDQSESESFHDLVNSIDHSNNHVTEGDYAFGICVKCGERVIGENSGCTAMDQIYHISCFTCMQCQINLQGKPFYALEGKPYCEEDYLNTLEKCSVCMKPILERILRATGKPYHPQCFTCVVCGNSLDGIPFTVDATNQNYCIEDFHKKFAPRCCVCRQPIMPEPGQEETVRVVALDRSFHFECYKCEDCGLLLSSEAEGRGCYPLDDHVLCKSCNAKRVQVLTNRMTTEL